MHTMKKRAKNGEALKWLFDNLEVTDEECLIWPFGKFADGYAAVQFEGKKWRASRLVCRLSSGEPEDEKLDAAHSCGKGHEGCVNPKHLRWATRKENCSDKIGHNTINRGVKNGANKLSEKQVLDIYSYKDTGLMQKEVAALFGISRYLVKSIWNGNNWSWLTKK